MCSEMGTRTNFVTMLFGWGECYQLSWHWRKEIHAESVPDLTKCPILNVHLNVWRKWWSELVCIVIKLVGLMGLIGIFFFWMGRFIFRRSLEELSILFTIDIKCSEIQTHYYILIPKLLKRVSHWPHRLGRVLYSASCGFEFLSVYGYMCALFLYWCPLGIEAMHSVCLQTFRRSGELVALDHTGQQRD